MGYRTVSSLSAVCLGIALNLASAQAAQYRFTPEPTYTPEAAEAIYKPLLDYLSKATGEKFGSSRISGKGILDDGKMSESGGRRIS